jgi:hypothetical protein
MPDSRTRSVSKPVVRSELASAPSGGEDGLL